MNEFDYEKANLADILRLVGELQHHRSHLLLALSNAPEEEQITLLVLAKQCQDLRRDIMRKHFGVEERHWCLMKSSAQMLQLVEETTTDDAEIFRRVKSIVDQTVEMATGEDISGCASCREDSKTEE